MPGGTSRRGLTSRCALCDSRLDMSGPQLRIQRLNAGIKVGDLAARMGISRTRIPQIEGSAVVSETLATRYLTALVELAAEGKGAA